MALTVGVCLSSFGSGGSLCQVTLEACCPPDLSGHCSTDCCDTETEGCCIVILSDELAMVSPEISGLEATVLSLLEYPPFLTSSRDGLAIILASVPDPPPLSGRERLARFEIQLV